MKTGADGRASVRVGRGLLTLSIHQNGYIPVDQVVDTRSMSGSVFEIKIVRVLQTHETVNVQATTEDITEQTSSPGESIRHQEAHESPLRSLTMTDAFSACSWGCACSEWPNSDRRSRGDAQRSCSEFGR
jgi:hypothetical protein